MPEAIKEVCKWCLGQESAARHDFDHPNNHAAAKHVYTPTDCRSCVERATDSFAPSHDGSSRCESGSIASGGTRSHCSCDVCF